MYKFAVATQQQLEQVGFKVEIQVVDWATLQQRRNNPDLWDAFTTRFPERADPTLHQAIHCNAIGGWNCDPDVAKLVQAMATERQFEQRYRLWLDLQRLFWERVPVIHYGHSAVLNIVRKQVKGPFDTREPYFWNVWLAQ